MRVLFDHSVPSPLRRHLRDHLVTEAIDCGWDTLENGALLTQAEEAGFEVLLTADKNIRYQQNLKNRKIAIIELSTPRWPLIRGHVESVAAAIDVAIPGSYSVVEIPWPPKPPFLRS